LLELLESFDTLRGRRHSQTLAQRGDRPDDRCAVRPLRQFADKALIDLDLVKRKASQVAQAGISCPKIIERDAHATLAQPMKGRQSDVTFLQQHGFGDLQFEPRRWQATLR